jgi:hypothetical protein
MRLSLRSNKTANPVQAKVRPQCAGCASFRGDPKDLEGLLNGLTSLSSAYASVRSDDGICLRHDRFVAARSSCADFAPVATQSPKQSFA